MAEVQMVIRTMSGAVIEGDWETTDMSPERAHDGFSAALGDPRHVVGIFTDGAVTFVRAAAIESLRYNTR